jgi:nucleoside phosphorylase
VSGVPVYFSHSYWREDRDLNDHFWRSFCDAGFSFTVDPVSPALNTTTLELMMARSVGFAAVVPFREAEARYRCSPFILHEYGLAVQTHQPRLVLRDKRVQPRYFRTRDTVEVEFDVAALDRCADEMHRRLDDFRQLTSSRSAGRRFRQGRVGIALPGGRGRNGSGARRAIVEHVLDEDGDEIVELARLADDPWELAQVADGCDFVVVDLDDHRSSRIADFLLGRGTPLLKMARRGSGPILPVRLLGSAPLRQAAAADELVTYWSDEEELESRLRHQVSQVMADRTELTDFETGHRYFRSLGRETRPVFISNAGPVNDVARDLAHALYLENIPFFHYRFQNPIGWGQRWAGQLDRMIAASKIFVPLIDDSYWASDYCRQEYETAVRLEEAGQLTIVPALVGGHDTGPDVPYQGADLRDRPREEQLQIVVSRLDELLAARGERSDRCGLAGPVAAGHAHADVAIITILAEEYAAVLRLLKRVRPVTGSATLDNQHAWVVGEVDAPGVAEPYTVVLAMSPHQGTNAAVIVTKNTLRAFDPRCVLVVGVAGGLDGLRLGDVVVADRICAYEYGAVDRGFHARDDLDSPTDAALASAARTLSTRHPGWYGELEQPGELRELTPRIVVGQVASGDKVIDDPTDAFFASVLRSRPRLQAIEMEGAGAAAAIQDVREMQRGASFGVIRGICDLPSGPRPSQPAGRGAPSECRHAWKVRASAAAAAAAIQLIRLSWPRPPRAAADRDPGGGDASHESG